MAVKMRRSSGNSANGNRKIVEVNDRIGGAKNTGEMQATTRCIYDSMLLVTTASGVTLNLFKNCRQRSFPLTNINENKLQKGEAMIVKRISFFIMECTAGTTNPLVVIPLQFFPQFQRLYAGTYALQFGQAQVAKPNPIFMTNAPFNPDARFMGAFQFQTFAAGDPTSDFQSDMLPHDNYEMVSDLVIPTDVEFQVDVQLPPFATPAGFDYYFGMQMIGLGSLLSAKTTF